MKTTKFYTLLVLLLMTGWVTMQAQENDRTLEYGYWADIVTEQPEGYVVDAEGNVEIYTPEGLAWLSCVVNGLNGCEPDNFDGRTVRLMADLNLEETYGLMNLVPIGNREHRFMGSFDGQDHSIDGLFILNTLGEEMRMDMALFGYLYHGTVKNLSLNSGFYAYMHPFDMNTGTYELYYDALVAAVSDSLSLVENCNCRLKVSELVGNAHPAGVYMAAFVGLNRNSTVRNCAYEMDNYSQAGGIDVGGIVLRNISEGDYADAIVENCYFYGSLMGSYSDENVGGIVCFNETVSNGKKAIVRNCYSELLDYLTGHYNKGCIVAYNSEGSVVENCFADVSGQQGWNGLFGTNLGETINCTEFVPYMGDGVLLEPVVIGETQTDRLVEALNAWVNVQEEPNLYREWIEGYYIPVPEFGEVWGVTENVVFSRTNAYPNPGKDVLNIRTGLQNARVEVHDTNGRLIHSQAITENVTGIDATDWADGVYVWKVYTGVSTGSTTLVETGKWIKQ